MKVALRLDRVLKTVELLDYDTSKHTGHLPPVVGDFTRSGNTILNVEVDLDLIERLRQHEGEA